MNPSLSLVNAGIMDLLPVDSIPFQMPDTPLQVFPSPSIQVLPDL